MGRLCIRFNEHSLAVGLELRWTLRASGIYNSARCGSISYNHSTTAGYANSACRARKRRREQVVSGEYGRPRNRGFFGKTVKTGT
jgi:hypothetical protein